MAKKPDIDLVSLPPAPEAETLTVIPEVDNAIEEIVGEAQLKEFIPGRLLFDYRNLLNQRLKKAETPEEEVTAIYNTQSWLLCQCFEVVERSDGNVRPLGLQDIASMDGEAFAFIVSGLMSIDIKINFLDETPSLKESYYFEITEKNERFRVEKLSVEKAVQLQQSGQKDPTGVKMNQWLICEKITLNGERIKEEDFNTKIDFSTAAVLEARINFLLEKYQQKRTSFSIRSLRAGGSET